MGRVAAPIVLAVLGLTLILGTPALDIPADLEAWLYPIGRVLLIVAVGWAGMILLDWRLARELRRADLKAEDNLAARKIATRINVLRRVASVLIAIITLSVALLAIPSARAVGVSLFASAGVAGLVVGIAARPVLSNLIAGLQVAFTQPIRIDDAVVLEGEWGWIEEVALFYVTVRLWDERRLVVPLTYFIEKPFQNWTRESAAIIGSIFWSVDYRAPIAEIRTKLEALCKASKNWDGRVCVLQVTEAKGDSLEIRALASARNSSVAWDLRCELREKMILWLQSEHPESLPRRRAEAEVRSAPDAGDQTRRLAAE
ncbi:MAG: mechanosensitive ion channel [Alphaproteobacteria bacterium]|nr:mechanosensitive ion channel [Alphaproteobacteria bacterium]